MQSNYKPVGKLKKGAQFKRDEEIFRITRSGFGTGKYVDVLFEKAGDPKSSTYCLPKSAEVEIVK